jgi:hypothetical protein
MTPPCPPEEVLPPCPPEEVLPPCPPEGGFRKKGFKPPLGGLGVEVAGLRVGPEILKPPLGGLGVEVTGLTVGPEILKPPLGGLGVEVTGLRVVLLRVLFFFLILTGLPSPAFSQSLNYAEIFGDDFKKALLFESENRSWMQADLAKNHISYPLAIAVIFPELVRYSALRDKMEITLLKALYINLGDEYANFSIGQFQMKPSFAQMVREQSHSVMNRRSGISFQRSAEYNDIKDYRKSIVKDLEDPKTEFSYLVTFMKICDKNFRTNRMDEITRLKFTATAYNYGINKSSGEIESMIDRKFFNTKLFKTDNYSYADVSLFWYTQYYNNSTDIK